MSTSYKSLGRVHAAKGEYRPPNSGFFGLKMGASEKEKKEYNQYREGHADKTRELQQKKK